MTPVHIDEVWAEIEPTVSRWLTRDDEPDATAVRQACLDGTTQAWRLSEGVVILRVVINPFTSERELLLRWGSAPQDEHGVFQRVLPELFQLAQRFACKRLQLHTCRIGWLRKAESTGGRLRNIELVWNL